MKNLKPSLFGRMLLLCSAVLAAGAPLASAKVTNYVGGCAGSPNFSTITAALATTPAPNVVEVCPGTYAEQVVITNPVTLEGIFTSNADQVVITVPSSGLRVTTPCATEGAAQVCAAAPTGTVNITNITVDGTGGVEPVGIAYNDASGTVNYVQTRNQGSNGAGMSLSGATNTVTVENSNVYNFATFGIFAIDGSGTGSEFTVKLEGNTLTPSSTADNAIWVSEGKSVTISGNLINGPSALSCVSGSGCGGIAVYTPVAGSITKNKVFGVGGSGGSGIYVGAGVGTISVTSNTVFDVAGDGIQINQAGVPVTGNTLMQMTNGINLECNVDSSVTGNTMTAVHDVGLANIATSTVPVNYYYDAPTLYSTCP
jgi:hypothetical protein